MQSHEIRHQSTRQGSQSAPLLLFRAATTHFGGTGPCRPLHGLHGSCPRLTQRTIWLRMGLGQSPSHMLGASSRLQKTAARGTRLWMPAFRVNSRLPFARLRRSQHPHTTHLSVMISGNNDFIASILGSMQVPQLDWAIGVRGTVLAVILLIASTLYIRRKNQTKVRLYHP